MANNSSWEGFSWYSMKIEGLKELEDVLIQMGEELGYDEPAKKVLKPALISAIQPVKLKLLQTIPYDDNPNREPGPHMRDSVRDYAKIPSDKDRRSIYVDKNDAMIGVVEIKTDKRGVSQEFGNAQVPAQPYLRNALESQIPEAIARFKGYLSWALKQYKSKKV